MNSPQNVILSIDEGTSGTRAAVVGQDGQVHCLEYHPLRVISPVTAWWNKMPTRF
jgi:glycerol kinase